MFYSCLCQVKTSSVKKNRPPVLCIDNFDFFTADATANWVAVDKKTNEVVDTITTPEYLAVVAGQITSSCIPHVDARDVVGNLVHGDYAMAGLSGLGLIPAAGDLAKGSGKAVKYVAKNADDLPEVVNLFEFLEKNFPDILKQLGKSDEFIEAAKKFSDDGAIRITRREANRIVKMCEEAGINADDVRNMTKLFEVPNSKFLEKNMISMGMTKPNYKCAAHHIVAGGSQKSKEARAILRKYGVGINDAANGVYLPTAKNVSNATYHPSMHSEVYY